MKLAPTQNVLQPLPDFVHPDISGNVNSTHTVLPQNPSVGNTDQSSTVVPITPDEPSIQESFLFSALFWIIIVFALLVLFFLNLLRKKQDY